MAYLFCFVVLIQLVFWAYFFRYAYAPVSAGSISADPSIAVSVIVCFRNEEANLRACVDRILAQSFPGKFELVLVDDNSTDNSVSIVHPYVIRHEHVRLLEPGATRPGKKDALAFGISHASYDHLLLLDADCVPASSHWLWFMTEPLRHGKELVVGVSPLFPGGRLNLLAYWQWFESVYVSLKYLGFAYRDKPYMGVGRNLAYTKAFYSRVGGFAAHADLVSGDDDLLVAGNARPGLTARVVDPAAWTHSSGQSTWKSYFRQRGRHQSTGVRYPRSTGALLGGVALSHGLFYCVGFLLLFTDWWWLALGAYALRLVYLMLAYHRPLLRYQPVQTGRAANEVDAYAERSRGAGTGQGSRWGWLMFTVMWGDALVGPMYLFLALSGLRPQREW